MSEQRGIGDQMRMSALDLIARYDGGERIDPYHVAVARYLVEHDALPDRHWCTALSQRLAKEQQ